MKELYFCYGIENKPFLQKNITKYNVSYFLSPRFDLHMIRSNNSNKTRWIAYGFEGTKISFK